MNQAGTLSPSLPFERRDIPRAALFWLLMIIAGGIWTALFPVPAQGVPLQSPSWQHWLGTDLLGRDFGWRLLAGGIHTLAVATAAACLSILLGGTWGMAAGASGGWIDRVLNRMMDVALSVPALILALVILAALGPGEMAVAIAVGVGGAATFARLVRAEAVQIRNREYFLASRALAAGGIRMVRSHLLPNIAGPLSAYGALHFGWALVNAASLTFLGFGGSPSAAEWGRMLGEARLVFWQAPAQAAATALALAVTVLAVQRIGRWGMEGDGR
jgi:ABC-type dipeptide/oligopeptide/nickel transport system permease subunit